MGQAAEVIVEELVLALVGLSAGAAVAGGLFSFIVELGVIADFADRTHTGDKLLFYETCVALGGIIGNIVFESMKEAERTQSALSEHEATDKAA